MVPVAAAVTDRGARQWFPTGFAVILSESSARRYALDPDVRLMLEVRDDNAAAFEELVARYQGRLVNLLQHQVGSRELAEDLAQDVFLRIYRARKSYQPGAKFATWLFTIAHHVASNALRDRSRHREVTLRAQDSGPLGARPLDKMLQASSGQMPARQLAKAEMRQMVQMAIDALGERQRMAVLLSKFEGLSYAEIAQIMEISPKAIKSLLSRARENLREVLQPYFDHGDGPLREVHDDR
ncbi:MAG: sigma-70 family RNA polymerase sigma factor [Planctomycetaceae bacterium]|nr:sigma-70 family RNA polymerase sigma factor [Planctomycetaceae bacterium]